MSRPLVIGHRGALHYCPENTLPSFQKALEQGVDGILTNRVDAAVAIRDEIG